MNNIRWTTRTPAKSLQTSLKKKAEEARWHVMSCRRLRHNRYNCQTQNIWHDCKNHIMYHQQRYTSKRYVESWSGTGKRGGRGVAVKHVPRVRQNIISIQRKIPENLSHRFTSEFINYFPSSLVFRTDWLQAHFQWLALTRGFDFTKDLDYRLNLKSYFHLRWPQNWRISKKTYDMQNTNIQDATLDWVQAKSC